MHIKRNTMGAWISKACVLTISAAYITASADIELIKTSVLATDANESMNGIIFQNEAILSHNGWQYASYYNNSSPRRIVIARRKFPDGDWQRFTFQDYGQTRDDGHNMISIGISPEDGTLHLSFDHHVTKLKYRWSKPGLLNNPETKNWDASQFNSITDRFDGDVEQRVTYPIFVHSPEGKLYFSRRDGAHGNGDQYLYEYSNGKWTTVGKYIEGNGANPYIDDLYFSKDGRLHVAWIWRTGPLESAYDICYAYSDDLGRTWFSSAGKKVGTTGDGAMDRKKVPELTVVPIAPGQLVNQEGMTVDSKGRVHIVHRLNNKIFHFYRDPEGKWYTIDTGFPADGPRRSIAADAQNNIYIMFSDVQIAMATEAGGFKDWKVVHQELKGVYSSAPLFDRYLLEKSNVLSLFMVKSQSTIIHSLDFKLAGGPNTNVAIGTSPHGAGPKVLFTPQKTLAFTAPSYPAKVVITDLKGGVIHSKTITGGTQIETQTMSGLYLVHLSNNEFSRTQKVIIR